MKPKTIIPLVMGVVVGGVAIKIVVDVVGSAQAATVANMSKCVVAKMDIDSAAKITPEMLMEKDWPKDAMPAQSFHKLEELKERVSSVFIPKDVPIYPSMLAPPGTPPGIQTRITQGYRAVSVAITEITGVAFQLNPGDRVDVVALVRHKSERGKGVQTVSRIILQNVELAAVGRTVKTGKGKDSGKSVARSVTLLLTPDEVTQLHLAQSLGGQLSLALRGNTDSDRPDVNSATTDNLLGGEASNEELGDDALASNQEPVKLFNWKKKSNPTFDVTVISGNDIQFVTFEQKGDHWKLKPDSEDGDDDPGDWDPGDQDEDLDYSVEDKDYSPESQNADE